MRAQLGGKGEPIPEFALPEPTLSGNLPPQVLVLEDGVPFVKADWVALGYTNYEVICVGGAGGRGADGMGRSYRLDTASEDDDRTYISIGWPYYIVPDPSRPGYTIQHLYNPQLFIHNHYDALWGGAGGGGGMHVVSGLLADLPDLSDVVVGQAGSDAPRGQIAQPNGITPDIATTYEEALDGSGRPYFPGAVYDEPHPTFYPPEAGEDGGASTFNGDTAQASGGKGGNPCAYWDGNHLIVDGKGGAGGSGGQSVAGGGAAGGSSEANAPDGSWDGTVGKGGGGGRSGTLPEPPPRPPDWTV